jgi:hypothetical protein
MPEPEMQPADASTGRRDLLKKLAVGSATVWVAPAIVSAPVAAQQASGAFSAVVNCVPPDTVVAEATIPAAYVNAGYYLSARIDADIDADTCTTLPTIVPIDSNTETWSFSELGLVGTMDVWIHNGDCVPIESISGIPFDCQPAGAEPGGGAGAPIGGAVITRSPDGEITVTGP